MTIRIRPVVIDTAGFQRRAWDFDYKGATYYIQETATTYYILKDIDETWIPVNIGESQQVITAFEIERGPDRSGLKE